MRTGLAAAVAGGSGFVWARAGARDRVRAVMTTPAPTTPALVADQLTKTYRNGVQALAGVSFQVAPGEIFGLLGPNGAGKSTTVRILATLTQPDGGSARIGGHDVMTDPQAVRRTIGYVAQASGVDRWAKAGSAPAGT